MKTKVEVCKILGISRQSLSEWYKKGLKSHNFEDIAIFLTNRIKDRTESSSNTLAEARKKLVEVNYKLKDYALKEKTGELVDKETIIKELDTCIIAFRNRLLGLVNNVSIRLYNKPIPEIKAILKEEVYKALREFSNFK